MDKELLKYFKDKYFKKSVKMVPCSEQLDDNVARNILDTLKRGASLIMATLLLSTAINVQATDGTFTLDAPYSRKGSMPSSTVELSKNDNENNVVTLGNRSSAGNEQNKKENTPFNIWSYNILMSTYSKTLFTENGWEHRKGELVKQILDGSPDIVCFQEMTDTMNAYLSNHLTEYGVFYGKASQSIFSCNQAIYYNKDRFTLLEGDKFYLSDTPEQESASFGADKRICVWAKLLDKVDNTTFYVYNTHYTYSAENKEARAKSSELINESISNLDSPVILLGDFNSNSKEQAYSILQESFANSVDVAETTINEGNTFHNFSTTEQEGKEAIDHIWLSTDESGVSQFSVSSYEVQRDYVDMLNLGNSGDKITAPSDHYAIGVEVTLNDKHSSSLNPQKVTSTYVGNRTKSGYDYISIEDLIPEDKKKGQDIMER